MLSAAIVAAVAAFGLLVAGLVTGQVWLAIACVVAAVIGLVLLVIDLRRGARQTALEDAPTTGAFLGEDVDAFVAQREARREAGTGGMSLGRVAAVGGFREAEPDFTGPLNLAGLAQPGAAAPAGDRPMGRPSPAPMTAPAPAQSSPAQSAPAQSAPITGPSFTLPTVSAPRRPPADTGSGAIRTGPGHRRVGNLHDYVASTGSVPRVEASGTIPADNSEPGTIRWESSIPPAGSALVSDQSREAIRHVNDLPPTPPTPRRPRRDEPPRAKPIDPLDPNWRPPRD